MADASVDDLRSGGGRTLLDHLPQALFLKDRSLRFAAVNRAFCAFLGLTEEEILGKDDFSLYPPDLAGKFRRDDLRVLEEGLPLEREERTWSRTGPRLVRVHKAPVHGPAGIEGVVGIFWDVTERRQVELQVRQTQRTEAIAQLAGAIAHDFDDLLGSVLDELRQARTRANAAPADLSTHLQAAEDAARRAGDLTRQLLTFARRHHPEPVPLDLAACLSEVAPDLTAELRRAGIGTTYRLDADSRGLRADPERVRQMVQLLVRLRLPDLPPGSTLEIAAQDVLVVSEFAALGWEAGRTVVVPLGHPESRPGEFVRLRLQDDGPGGHLEETGCLTEPFGRPPRRSGLESLTLPMVRNLMQDLGGWIECHDDTLGVHFDLYFPRETRLASADTPAFADPARPTILLVDDHEVVRRIGRDLLEGIGLQVRTCVSGREAECLLTADRKVDLVLLDATLHGEEPVEIASRLQGRFPDLPIVACAPCPPKVGRRLARKMNAAAFVPKPFRVDELRRVVLNVLAGSGLPTYLTTS